MLEAYATLGFLAARTERVRMGTMVSGGDLPPPALLVKAVTTLDVLTGGRAWLGLGAGYHEHEARARACRCRRWASASSGSRRRCSWRGRCGPATRRRSTAATTGSGIRSAARGRCSAPHPPILIGGTGERQTLRLVAQYADACNLFDIPDGGETIRRKLDVLAGHCAEAGRDRRRDLEKTVSTRLRAGETAAEVSRSAAGR